MVRENIAKKLKELPSNPGVYIMLDDAGEIIYIGKARVLKNRVRQYFQSGEKTVKVEAMVAKIADFRYIITKSEVDALLLENNLIKEHKPYYNILLKDDKNYAYIKINTKEPYPYLEHTRRLVADGAKYFGPFMQGITVKQVIEIVNDAYPIRTCKRAIPQKRKERPCLNYHLGKCKAPCNGFISEKEYAELIDEVIEFLRGKDTKMRTRLQEKMTSSAEKLDFESAIEARGHIELLDKMVRNAITALARAIDADIFALRKRGGKSVIGMLSVRSGKMVGGDNFEIEDEFEKESLADFVSGFYPVAELIPKTVVVEEQKELLDEYFARVKQGVEVKSPIRGALKELLKMAGENADNFLDRLLGERAEALKLDEALASLGRELGIPPPSRMECYDISHASGTLKVASMVVFENGKKSAKEYRRFKIKTVEGSDDFACMKEALERRIDRYLEGDKAFCNLPDLIVIDGGKGQLSSANEILKNKGIRCAIVGLAKKEELIFRPGESEPIVLSHKSAPLMMLQRLRDEAHRFAITYHRRLRADNMTRSELSGIKGIGEARINALYREFRSIDRIATASITELSAVKGITKKDAESIYAHFHSEDQEKGTEKL